MKIMMMTTTILTLTLTCNLCEKSYEWEKDLQRHVGVRHAVHPRGNMFSCNLCEKSYEWKDSLQRHMRVKHAMRSSPYRPYEHNVFRRIGEQDAKTFTWSWQSKGNWFWHSSSNEHFPTVNLCRLDAQHNSPAEADSFCCITTHPVGEKTYFCHLGWDTYIECMRVGCDPRIDLRQWKETTTGLYNTQRGVSLNTEGWQKLMSVAEAVDCDIELLKEDREVSQMYPLTNEIFVSVKNPYLLVDIRYWLSHLPARGIKLRISEWHALLQANRLLKTLLADQE